MGILGESTPYRKLRMRLESKGLSISARELKTFCTGKLVAVNGIEVSGDYHIEVHPEGRYRGAVYFENMRQVQRWFDNKMSDSFLPTIRFKDGTRIAQHRSW